MSPLFLSLILTFYFLLLTQTFDFQFFTFSSSRDAGDAGEGVALGEVHDFDALGGPAGLSDRAGVDPHNHALGGDEHQAVLGLDRQRADDDAVLVGELDADAALAAAALDAGLAVVLLDEVVFERGAFAQAFGGDGEQVVGSVLGRSRRG